MTLIQQQRLIGAVLLLCLIGVIAFFLLSSVQENEPLRPEKEPINFDSVVEPIGEDVEVVEPVDEALVDPHGLDKRSPVSAETGNQQPEEALETATEAEDTALPAPALPQVESEQAAMHEPKWVLQVASFSKRANADSLAAQLSEMGYAAMIETTTTDSKPIYRVRLQPTVDRSKLEQAAQSINEKLKLSTQILHYEQ
jgi:DedD protein